MKKATWALLIAATIYCAGCGGGGSDSPTGSTTTTEKFAISNVTHSTSGGYTYADGTVTNNTDQTESLVIVYAQALDASGTVLDSDLDTVTDLAPGQSGKWHCFVQVGSSTIASWKIWAE